MKRISSNMGNTDMQYHLRLREWQMNSQQNKMAEQTRIGELRDDPVANGSHVIYPILVSIQKPGIRKTPRPCRATTG